MNLTSDPVTLFNFIFCILIVIVSIWGYRKTGSYTPLSIGAAFGLFAISHAATLLDLAVPFRSELLFIRTTAYILVVAGFFLLTLDIIQRKLAENALREVHDGLEHRITERTRELAVANETLQNEIISRKNAEEEARLSERRLMDIVNFLPDPTMAIDVDGTIITWNRAIEEMTGKRAEDMLGKGDYEFALPFYQKRRPMLLDFVLKPEIEIDEKYSDIIQRSRDVLIAETSLPQLQGRSVVLWGKASPLYDYKGNITGAIESIRDITERKRNEETIKQVNRKLNLLSGITRHDINNQLFALQAYIELSKRSLGDPALTSEYIAKQEKIANTIAHQISFTKQYEDLGVKAPAWQNVNRIIKSVISRLPMRNICVNEGYPDLEVFADPLLEKVFYNLIDNALHYGGEQMTSIHVRSRIENGVLTLVVEDDGTGITAEDKTQLFTKGFGKHTGLGLYLSKEILAMTDITINETGVPGKGARFEMTVPDGTYRFTGKS